MPIDLELYIGRVQNILFMLFRAVRIIHNFIALIFMTIFLENNTIKKKYYYSEKQTVYEIRSSKLSLVKLISQPNNMGYKVSKQLEVFLVFRKLERCGPKNWLPRSNSHVSGPFSGSSSSVLSFTEKRELPYII